jgi:predicted Zn-dependent protease
MIYSYTRIASLVLAFGFFFGCSILQNSSDPSSEPISDNLTEAQLEKQLIAVRNQIDENPNNPELYYRKGVLLTQWAPDKAPSERTAYYTEAREALHTADSLYKRNPSDETGPPRTTDQLRSVAWSNEHNQGIAKLQNAGSRSDYLQSATHFRNASIIMPDSVIAYQMASEAFYRGEQPQEALQILKKGLQNIGTPSVKLLESLAYLYLETNQPERSVKLFEQARSLNQRNFNIMHGLSNAYIQAGDHQKAIALLRQLSDRQPGNTTYQRTLASQLYEAGSAKLTDLLTQLKERDRFSKELFTAGNSLLKQAEEQYTSILEEGGSHKEMTKVAAQFYYNRAALYQKLLPYLPDAQNKELEPIIKRSLSASIPLLQKLTASAPSKQLWQNLYQAYTYLGMQEEAKKAKTNI